MSACITVAFNDTCPLGFFCPNSDANHPPQVCMPSPECAIKRLHGFNCEAQGPLEPRVCQPGYFCPAGGKQKIPCPAKHFCPTGSYKPLPCGLASICHTGSSVRIFPLPAYIALGFDVLLIIKVIFALCHQKQSAKRRAKEDQEVHDISPASTDGATELLTLYPTSVTIIDTLWPRRRGPRRPVPQVPPDEYEAAILQFIRRARVETGLDFEFVTAEGQQNRIPRGSVVGVIGQGKTNFTRVMAGQEEPAKDTKKKAAAGVVSVHINGHHVHPRTFQRIISVVPREGITTPHLTVRENILHAANMRLPRTFSRSDRHTFVDALITYFDLYDVQHSLVGSSRHPVISEAQRRLVDIAMALAAGPTAIFLDEPTAHMNLDEAAALFRLLKFISQEGVTVAVTMNQPTRDVWDNIYLDPRGSHTPCAYPYVPTTPSSLGEIQELKVASGDRGFPWFQQLWVALQRLPSSTVNDDMTES